jgi:hypothetical protein
MPPRRKRDTDEVEEDEVEVVSRRIVSKPAAT